MERRNYFSRIAEIKKQVLEDIRTILKTDENCVAKGNRWEFAYFVGCDDPNENNEDDPTQWDLESCPWVDYPAKRMGDYCEKEGIVSSVYLKDNEIYVDIFQGESLNLSDIYNVADMAQVLTELHYDTDYQFD